MAYLRRTITHISRAPRKKATRIGVAERGPPGPAPAPGRTDLFRSHRCRSTAGRLARHRCLPLARATAGPRSGRRGTTAAD